MLMASAIEEVLNDPALLEVILSAFKAENENIRKYAMRIIGNTMSLKEEFIGKLH